jgi:hypothetical protein
VIIILHGEDWFSISNRQLYKDSHSSEAGCVLLHGVSEMDIQALVVLESLIHMLLTGSYHATHPIMLRVSREGIGCLHGLRSFAPVATISFNALGWLEKMLHSMSEDCDVWILSGRERAMYPDDVRAPDTKAHFVAQRRLLVELVR